MMCVDTYPTIEQQIQEDAMLSRQIHEEVHIQFRKQMNQLEDNKPTEYFDSMEPQSIPKQYRLAGDRRFEQRIVEFIQNSVGFLIKKK